MGEAVTHLVGTVRHPKCDAHNILPRLWQGSAPPPGQTVSRNGFQAIVLSAEEYQPEGRFFRGVDVMHAPLDDHHEPLTTGEWDTIIRAAEFAGGNVMLGRRVLVTCQAGLNRSGIITAVTVCMLTGLTGSGAVRLVQMRRPGALKNQSFANHIKAVMV